MSKEGKEIKITDKRMFTADGELREEYRFLDEKSTAEPPAPAAGAAPASEVGEAAGAAGAAPPPRRGATPPAPAAAAPAAGAAATLSGASGPGGGGPPGAGGSPAGRGAERGGREAGRSPRSPAAADVADLTDLGDLDDDPMDRREPSARLELPGTPPGLGPSFYDLAALLAEPVPIYLGDVELPDGQSAENVEMARLYIDLLDVLRQKTAGNLTAQESAFLEDLLYRLRVRYVQKRG